LVGAVSNQERFPVAFAPNRKWFRPAPALFRCGHPDETKPMVSPWKTQREDKWFKGRGKIKSWFAAEPVPLAAAGVAG
jgi:hypothetical protein